MPLTKLLPRRSSRPAIVDDLVRRSRLLTAAIVFLAAAFWSAESRAADAAPGNYVVLDGRCLHYVEFGDPTGEVTVILEAGGGAFSTFWLPVQHEAATVSGVRFLAYDRAGLGWSDPRPGAYAIEQDADDLAALLEALAIEEPVVLVGSSYGSFVAKLFAQRHPNLLLGIVLVDPNTAAFFQENPDIIHQIEASAGDLPMNWLQRTLARSQTRRFAEALGSGPEVTAAFERYLSRSHQEQTAAFLAAFGPTVEAAAATPWPDRPMILISRGHRDDMFPWTTDAAEKSWRDAQRLVVDSVHQAEFWLATNSGHAVALDQPAIIVDAIQAMASKIRDR